MDKNQANENEKLLIEAIGKVIDSYLEVPFRILEDKGNYFGTAIKAVGAVPSADRTEMDHVFEKLKNELSDDWSISRRGMDIVLTLTKFSDLPDTTPTTAMQVTESLELSDEEYTEQLSSLLEFMRDNLGMKISPLPEVVIRYDEENSKSLFGKTAYYDPNDKVIVLYAQGRHPKDILRSFCHEMVHHEQNLNGRLPKTTTQNTQEDDSLRETEQEAHYKGSMIFREWEDTQKLNDIIPGGLAQGKSIQDIADHHNVDVKEIHQQLQKGIKIEMEHTDSVEAAKEIAMDHLWENPKYYDHPLPESF